jgi:hypothetical protein
MHRLARHPDFVRRDAEVHEVEAYCRGLRGDQPVRAGMLSNPMAATNWRSVAHERLIAAMAEPRSCVSTPSLADLPWALDYLLFQRVCNVIVVNGGDGTIHHLMNATIGVLAAASERLGAPVPAPVFLFVNGGGMNMVARAFRTRGHPVRTLRRFLRVSQGKPLGALRVAEIPLLAVSDGSGRPRHGFIFGSELVLNALTMYERFGRGYSGLARFLWEVFAGLSFKTALWYRFGHLLDAPTTPAWVDGRELPRYTSLVVATAPMTLLQGVVRTLPRVAAAGTVNTIEVLATDKARVIAAIPRLMQGLAAPGVRYCTGVTEVRLFGPYTVDGERVTRVVADQLVTVRATDRVIRGVWLGRSP